MYIMRFKLSKLSDKETLVLMCKSKMPHADIILKQSTSDFHIGESNFKDYGYAFLLYGMFLITTSFSVLNCVALNVVISLIWKGYM